MSPPAELPYSNSDNYRCVRTRILLSQKKSEPNTWIRFLGKKAARLDNHASGNRLIRLLVDQNEATGNTVGLVAIRNERR